MDLQIIRTRHPPAAYHAQLAQLLQEAVDGLTAEDVKRRLERLSESDRLFLALAFFAALGYEQLATTQEFNRDLEAIRRSEAPTQPA